MPCMCLGSCHVFNCISDKISAKSTSDSKNKCILYLHTVIVFSTCLYFLSFPTYHAQPIPMSSSADGPALKISGSTLNQIERSSISAHGQANVYLQKLYNELVGIGMYPDKTFETVFYDWLPTLPDMSTEDKKEAHFAFLKTKLDEGLLSVFEKLQISRVAMQAVITDHIKREGDPEGFLGKLNGLVNMIVEEMQQILTENNIPIPETVQDYNIPEQYRNLSDNKTRRTERDWIVIREFIKVMKYTMDVMKDMQKEDYIEA